jgi:branched-chain amino acid transport system permease protein
MDLQTLIFQLLNGLIWGLILALITLGLTLIFGILNVVNIAHAALYMLGAVLAWEAIQYTGSFWAAIIIAPLLVGLVSVTIERIVLRPISGNFVLSIVATLGVLFIIQDTVLATFGGGLQRISSPIQGTISLLGLRYPYYRVFVAAVSIMTMLAVWLFLNRTKYGLWIRAVKQDPQIATAMGIPVSVVYMSTVALGGILAGLGGVLAGPIVAIEYQMGLKILAYSFIIVVVGGFGSIMGSIVVAILIGCMDGVFTTYFSASEARIMTLVLVSLILLLRPEGIFQASRRGLY